MMAGRWVPGAAALDEEVAPLAGGGVGEGEGDTRRSVPVRTTEAVAGGCVDGEGERLAPVPPAGPILPLAGAGNVLPAAEEFRAGEGGDGTGPGPEPEAFVIPASGPAAVETVGVDAAEAEEADEEEDDDDDALTPVAAAASVSIESANTVVAVALVAVVARPVTPLARRLEGTEWGDELRSRWWETRSGWGAGCVCPDPP